MSIFLKLLILLIFLAGLGVFILNNPNVKSIIQLYTDNPEIFPRISLKNENGNKKHPVIQNTNQTKSMSQTDAFKTYKWIDANGLVHYSDRKSTDNSQLTELKGITILNSKNNSLLMNSSKKSSNKPEIVLDSENLMMQ